MSSRLVLNACLDVVIQLIGEGSDLDSIRRFAGRVLLLSLQPSVAAFDTIEN